MLCKIQTNRRTTYITIAMNGGNTSILPQIEKAIEEEEKRRSIQDEEKAAYSVENAEANV